MSRPRRPKRSKINATGRNEQTERFARLPHRILISEAYRSLDLVARALLTELVMMENGSNNGSLWLSVADATDRLGQSDARPAMRGFDDLVDRGFIQMTKDAHFSIKAAETSRARCWRLTWLAFDRKPPSNNWQSYIAPPKTKARKAADKGLRAMARFRKALSAHKLPVVDFTALDAVSPSSTTQAAGEFTTGDRKAPGNPPSAIAGNNPVHVAVTI